MAGKSYKVGKQFEKDFKDSVVLYPDIYIQRFKDSAFYGYIPNVKTQDNPCDYFMYRYPNLFLLEMKSTGGSSFSFSEAIIKQHQIDDLLFASETKGVIAGFLFNFREREFKTKPNKPNATYFVNVIDFAKFKEKSNKASINEKDCKEIGHKLLQRKKIIHFEYDIYDLIENITKTSL